MEVTECLTLLGGAALSAWLLARPTRCAGRRAEAGKCHGVGRRGVGMETWWPGRWYQIAYSAGPFEKVVNTCTNVSLHFTLLDDGTMDMSTSSFKPASCPREHRHTSWSGSAAFKGDRELEWTFEMLDGLVSFSLSLKVLFVSPDYSWCILSPTAPSLKESVHLFCREPRMAPCTLKNAVGHIKALGFNLANLVPSCHNAPEQLDRTFPTTRRYGILRYGEASNSRYLATLPANNLLISPYIFHGTFDKSYCERVISRFWAACSSGDVCFVSTIVGLEPLWLDIRNPQNQWSCLHYAVYNAQIDLVGQVVTQGANVKARTSWLENALHVLVGGFVRHVKERHSWDAGGSTCNIFASMNGDDQYSGKIHSLKLFEKTARKLIKLGVSRSDKNFENQRPLAVMEDEIQNDAHLAAWLCNGTTLACEEVRESINAMVGILKEDNYPTATVHTQAPWMFAMFVVFDKCKVWCKHWAVSGKSVLECIVLFTRLLASILFFLVIFRITGSLFIKATTWNRDRRKDKVLRFKGDCIALAFFAMDNAVMYKIAQILSGNPKMCSPETRRRLSIFGHSMDAISDSALEGKLTSAFGKNREHIFQFFDRTPFAAGTVCQIHRAKLANGGPWVAVKIVRNSKKFESDVSRFWSLINKIVNFRWVRTEAVTGRVERLYSVFLSQTDMLLECASMKAMQLKSELNEKVGKGCAPKVPHVYPSLTTRDVLTMELVEGAVPFDEFDQLQVPRPVLANRFGIFFLKSTLIDGIFPADFTPGNLFFDPSNNGKMTVLDYGMVCELSEQLRVIACTFMLCALAGEVELLSDVFRRHFVRNSEQVFVSEEIKNMFDGEFGPLIRKYFLESGDFDVISVNKEFDRLVRKYNLKQTPVFAAFEFSLFTYVGTVTLLRGKSEAAKILQQFIATYHREMLDSIESSEFYDRIYPRIMERYGWGAIIHSGY
mmetsp:Transcript_11518/g.18729  ORF Transcript_11518/g.18729 Transcript_11518/m.18729 type:complete len:947 (+) Transcript_11518:166-3006(+)|eukprot:CAMPEP_0203747200 /NCGR_PEP_ID=MMETSP0098-20131031/2425_1 /ASSEMBLY_ACC=CAM_ASM_000208 /TAXON_ID=96639 /ORGANISM=" , Strain NY0313808BC1" /LENGTH=946 /DNA_ID=CAMNT_0050635565 /DNA_START=519 /DNA_END=3359 /DNA_ORIENTATION=+